MSQQLWLSASRSIYWENQKALILSDVHFGKTGHFRKEGIAVPQNVYREDLQRLFSTVQHFRPEKLIVVGDLFHSRPNKELELFSKWRNDITNIEIHLVMGNHDILGKAWYEAQNICIHDHAMRIENFVFTHDPQDKPIADESLYFFSGHLHPGIKLSGAGKQSLRFPCFYFSRTQCILPAFGKFTGLSLIQPKAGEKVFAVVNHDVIPLT